jgi:hypothetical protein
VNGARSDGKALGAAYPDGTTLITWTATDAVNNTASCIQRITVTPAGSGGGGQPGITCPADVTAQAATGRCTATNVAVGTPSTTITGATITGVRSDGQAVTAAYPLGLTTINWTATGTNGQTASCTQKVTVNGTAAPSITCPVNVIVTAGSGQSSVAVNPGLAVATSSCGQVGVSGVRSDGQSLLAVYPIGTTTITWTATDDYGNMAICNQTVTVNPYGGSGIVITCPPDIVIYNSPGFCYGVAVPGVPTATQGGYPIATIRGTRADGLLLTDVYPLGTTTINWTATGTNGQIASCTQRVIVKYNEPPRITCPQSITVAAPTGQTTAVVNPGTATSTDNCAQDTIIGVRSDGQSNLGAPYPIGVTTITWTARDNTYNLSAQCTQTITVTSGVSGKITITCPNGVGVNSQPGFCYAVLIPANPTTHDTANAAVTVTGARSDGVAMNAAFPVGITTITWTATDTLGNRASCTTPITVKDTQAPSVICPANITVSAQAGQCTATVNIVKPTVTDNCAGATVSGTRSDGLTFTQPFPIGVTSITWVATDASGNTSSCVQTVTVKDVTGPVISGLSATPTTLTPVDGTMQRVIVLYSAVDACSPANAVTTRLGVTSNETLAAGDVQVLDAHHALLKATHAAGSSGRIYTLTAYAADAYGNMSSQSVTVAVPR